MVDKQKKIGSSVFSAIHASFLCVSMDNWECIVMYKFI